MPGESEPSRLHHDFTLRAATKDDLDDITRIHRDGFTEEPQVLYCYPFRNQYPGDFWKWTRKEYDNYLEQPQKFVFHVVEAPSESEGRVTAGLAVWNVAVLIKADPTGTLKSLRYFSLILWLTYALTDIGLKDRRDANKKHCETAIEVAGRRFKTYFAEYAEEQINLSILVVHPDFRRRGAGTMLVNWGIEAAEEKGWPVTLCASPMGQLLYKHLQFEKVATEVVRVEGEEETCISTVMVLKTK